ncbi:hypothetical protein ACS0TY_035784 [Phlomoides rotata]
MPSKYQVYSICKPLIAGGVVGGIKAQVASIGQVENEAAQKVEAPVVVITGASKGIGKAIALALGNLVARFWLNMRGHRRRQKKFAKRIGSY